MNDFQLTVNSLMGTWRFIGSTMIDEQGKNMPDPVNDSQGLIAYTDKHMSVQIASDSRKNDIATTNYIAYCGTYDFDSESQVVTHHVRLSNIPDMLGLSVQRKVTYIDKQTITLMNIEPEKFASDIKIIRTLTWIRED